jgi:hypothetical protein
MKLSDIMSGSGLSAYAEIALVLFLVAFLAVVVSLFLPSWQRTYERMRHLPMDHDTAAIGSLSRDDGDSSTRFARSE